MTAMLRERLRDAESINAIAKATDVQRASLLRFRAGAQSLRLDMADRLCEHFGIEHVQRRRKG